MEIKFDSSFKKAYKRRIAINLKLVEKTRQRIIAFQSNRQNPLLKDHSLKGEHINKRAFWITGDIRIVYYLVSDQKIIFVDIGSHNQVY